MTAPRQSARKLMADALEPALDATQFGFSTTEHLEPLKEIVGQPRALRALDLGLAVEHPSYNIYMAGLSGMGRKGMIRQALMERVAREPTPPDWVYLNNFEQPDQPLAISLPPGQAMQLKRDMQQLIEQLREELPKAFRREDLRREQQQLNRQFQQQSRELSEQLEQAARQKGLTVQQLPDGQIVLLPVKEGKAMTFEEIEQLPEEERREIEQREQQVAEHAASFLSHHQEMSRQFRNSLRQLQRDFADRHIQPLVQRVAECYDGDRQLKEWFGKLQLQIVEHLERFQPDAEGQQQQMAALMAGAASDPEQRFRDYEVNVLVDNSQVEGAPVIIEDVPNYKNLFGIIDLSTDRFGHSVTDFTRIKAGSLLRANGGYLVFNLVDALIEPVVWKELKRAIKSGCLQIEAYEPLGMFSTTALKPTPIPLRVKLVVEGNPLVYHMLHLLDEDFPEIFKVKAEFDPSMERAEGEGLDNAGVIVGRLLQKLTREEGEKLMPFQASAVAELIRAGARLVDDQRKLTTELSRVADLAREANFWAGRERASAVGAEHVRQAVQERVYRSDLIAAKIREMIADGTIGISLQGAVVGQVNGLSVANLGDYMFGRPARVTASVGVGLAGIINIERESKLSGRIHDKGMLILEGFLRNQYSRQQPLALSASLTLEQSYGLVDGDSASVAELICLLSALAEIPLRQDIAVTGSVNQWGQVQAVGGVNEKIEGFFDVCNQQGLSGQQGVVIPASNRNNLVLRPDVINAVRQERFHVWTVEHTGEVLELLTQLPVGDLTQEGSFHWRVHQRLRELAAAMKEQHAAAHERFAPSFSPSETPRDPRPPLPGRGA